MPDQHTYPGDMYIFPLVLARSKKTRQDYWFLSVWWSQGTAEKGSCFLDNSL